MDEVFISADVPAEFKAEIIRRCMGGKQVIYVVPHLFEISLINAQIMQLDDIPAFMVDKLGLTVEQAFVKANRRYYFLTDYDYCNKPANAYSIHIDKSNIQRSGFFSGRSGSQKITGALI